MRSKEIRTITFDPQGGETAPFITEVEMLLGGIGRLVFPDGTEQFVDDDDEPVYVYSPRLAAEELEAFCEANIERYRSFYDQHLPRLVRMERVPMDKFW